MTLVQTILASLNGFAAISSNAAIELGRYLSGNPSIGRF